MTDEENYALIAQFNPLRALELRKEAEEKKQGSETYKIIYDKTYSSGSTDTYETGILAHSLEEALKIASGLDQEEIHIGGGAEIYKQALPYVDRLYLTLVEDEKEADTFFPEYDSQFTKVMNHEHREHNGLKYS